MQYNMERDHKHAYMFGTKNCLYVNNQKWRRRETLIGMCDKFNLDESCPLELI